MMRLLPALKAAFERWRWQGGVFKSEKTGDLLENGRHLFDDAIAEAKLKNFHWHDLRCPSSCYEIKSLGA